MLVLLVALVDDDVEVGDVLDDVGDLVDDEVEVEDGPGEEQHREDDLSHLGGITGGSKLFSRKNKNHQLQSLCPGGASSLSQELETLASSLSIVCVKKLKVQVTIILTADAATRRRQRATSPRLTTRPRSRRVR